MGVSVCDAKALMQEWTTPHPGCFGDRGCKSLKIKGGSTKKRAKRPQVPEKSRLDAGGLQRLLAYLLVVEGTPRGDGEYAQAADFAWLTGAA